MPQGKLHATPSLNAVAEKRAGARWSVGIRAMVLSGLKSVAVAPMDPLLWLVLEHRTGKIPALVDIGD